MLQRCHHSVPRTVFVNVLINRQQLTNYIRPSISPHLTWNILMSYFFIQHMHIESTHIVQTMLNTGSDYWHHKSRSLLQEASHWKVLYLYHNGWRSPERKQRGNHLPVASSRGKSSPSTAYTWELALLALHSRFALEELTSSGACVSP